MSIVWPSGARPVAPRAATERLRTLLSTAYLSLLIGFAVRFMSPSLFRTWFFNSDEYVVVAEVIRFAQLDFRQHFFDMPGTPLMFLASGLWSLFFAVHRALGNVAVAEDIGDFTFQHLQALFVMVRGLTFFFFCLSVILVFWLTTRLISKPAGWVAAFLVAMSSTYAMASASVRVESLSMCFSLAAMLCVVHALDCSYRFGDEKRGPFGEFVNLFFVGGVLAGLGAATRLHSIVMSVPTLVLMLAFSKARQRYVDYPRSIKTVLGLMALGLAAVGWLMVTWRADLISRPHARQLLDMSLMAASTALVLGFFLYQASRTRILLIRTVSPDLIRLLAGCGAGLLLGMPTIIRQHTFFLSSIEAYSSGYSDVMRMGWPLWRNVQWYLTLYLGVVAPSKVEAVLLAVGAACIIYRRDRRLLPFLIGAFLFFVSKPLNLLAAPHHVILWLPLFAIVCSYPVGWLFEVMSERMPYGRAWAPLVFLIGFTTLALSVTPGPTTVATELRSTEERLRNILAATQWIKQRAEPQEIIAVRYYCFNPDIFYVWVRSLDVPVPPSLFDGPMFSVWWGTASSLKGTVGYMCATPQDLALQTELNIRLAGDVVDPLTDPRFHRAQAFGTGINAVNLFRFDFR